MATRKGKTAEVGAVADAGVSVVPEVWDTARAEAEARKVRAQFRAVDSTRAKLAKQESSGQFAVSIVAYHFEHDLGWFGDDAVKTGRTGAAFAEKCGVSSPMVTRYRALGTAIVRHGVTEDSEAWRVMKDGTVSSKAVFTKLVGREDTIDPDYMLAAVQTIKSDGKDAKLPAEGPDGKPIVAKPGETVTVAEDGTVTIEREADTTGQDASSRETPLTPIADYLAKIAADIDTLRKLPNADARFTDNDRVTTDTLVAQLAVFGTAKHAERQATAARKAEAAKAEQRKRNGLPATPKPGPRKPSDQAAS